MVACSWYGFAFYAFAFVFFLVGIIATLFDVVSHITFGLKKGFLFQYDDNKFSNPMTNILFFGFMILVGTYIVGFDISPKVIQYWECLHKR